MSGKIILAVDDDPTTLKLLNARFREDGHDIRTAETAGDAIRQAKECPPDIVIMDLLLPDMPGEEAVVELLQMFPSREMTIIFLSGILLAEDGEGVESQQVRVKDEFYPAVGKPVNFERLMSVLNI
ncbi:MAG: response regulator [Candidatus Omnitrophota bacterium]